MAKILLINPNSSTEMTLSTAKSVATLFPPDTLEIVTYTAPSPSPPSINDATHITYSTSVVLADLSSKKPWLASFDGVIIACFSIHPLVPSLASLLAGTPTFVTGIFESGITAAASLSRAADKWAIVTTGTFWEDHLTNGVNRYLGGTGRASFDGVYCTGVTAGDFHGGDEKVVLQKLEETVRQAINSGVRWIVLGCAGMAGFEEVVQKVDSRVGVIDGGKAAVLWIMNNLRAETEFSFAV